VVGKEDPYALVVRSPHSHSDTWRHSHRSRRALSSLRLIDGQAGAVPKQVGLRGYRIGMTPSMDLYSAFLVAWILIAPVLGWGAYLLYTRLARRTERKAVRKRNELRL
jgi:hypothetical protein